MKQQHKKGRYTFKVQIRLGLYTRAEFSQNFSNQNIATRYAKSFICPDCKKKPKWNNLASISMVDMHEHNTEGYACWCPCATHWTQIDMSERDKLEIFEVLGI